jgi:hypothetical protein
LLIIKNSEYHGTRKFKEDKFFVMPVVLAPPFTPIQANAGTSQLATHREEERKVDIKAVSKLPDSGG